MGEKTIKYHVYKILYLHDKTNIFIKENTYDLLITYKNMKDATVLLLQNSPLYLISCRSHFVQCLLDYLSLYFSGANPQKPAQIEQAHLRVSSTRQEELSDYS